jgi:phosphatidylserine decarboxylase
MKLHKESKGTILVASIAFLAVYFLQEWSLVITIPLLLVYGLIFWFFRVPVRDIKNHMENVIAPVDGKVIMIKKVMENEFIKGKAIQVSIFSRSLNYI